MVIPDSHRRAVAFVCYRDKLGRMHFAGTCFFLGLALEGRARDGSEGYFPYTITAKHVIVLAKDRSADGKAILRVNLTEGGVQYIDTNADDWLSNIDDPSNIDASDVAILSWIPSPDEGYNLTCIMNDPIQKEENVNQIAKVGLGDDVAIVGLFVNHTGKERNAPIVRVGNVALLADENEKVKTKFFGFIEAHLIECRSIGGLSGSPVFVLMTGPRIDESGKAIFLDMRHIYLLGLLHGHYDVSLPEEDEIVGDDLKKEAINTGIAIVVPARTITDVLNLPQLVNSTLSEQNTCVGSFG